VKDKRLFLLTIVDSVHTMPMVYRRVAGLTDVSCAAGRISRLWHRAEQRDPLRQAANFSENTRMQGWRLLINQYQMFVRSRADISIAQRARTGLNDNNRAFLLTARLKPVRHFVAFFRTVPGRASADSNPGFAHERPAATGKQRHIWRRDNVNFSGSGVME
jgi:hypothetical protein